MSEYTQATAPRSAASATLAVAHKVNAIARDSVNWAKALLMKAAVAVKGGWLAAYGFIQNLITRNGLLVGAAGATVLATKRGYHGMLAGVRWLADKAVNLLVAGARLGNKAVGYGGTFLGRAIGWLHSSTGKAVEGYAVSATCVIETGISWFAGNARSIIAQVNAAAISGFVTKAVNWTAMAGLVGIAANVLTGGTVAATAATLPVVGTAAAAVVVGGPWTLLFLGAVAALGTAYVFFFDAAKALDDDTREAVALDAESKELFEEAEALHAAAKNAGKKKFNHVVEAVNTAAAATV